MRANPSQVRLIGGTSAVGIDRCESYFELHYFFLEAAHLPLKTKSAMFIVTCCCAAERRARQYWWMRNGARGNGVIGGEEPNIVVLEGLGFESKGHDCDGHRLEWLLVGDMGAILTSVRYVELGPLQ